MHGPYNCVGFSGHLSCVNPPQSTYHLLHLTLTSPSHASLFSFWIFRRWSFIHEFQCSVVGNITNLLFRMDTLDFLASLENMTDTCEYFRDIFDMADTVDILFCMVLALVTSLTLLNFTRHVSQHNFDHHLFSNYQTTLYLCF